MNWDQIERDWMQFQTGVQRNWIKLTDDDLARVGGCRDLLVERLRIRYGFARSEAEREIEAWLKTQRRVA